MDKYVCQQCNLEIFCTIRGYDASKTYCVCLSVSCQCEACSVPPSMLAQLDKSGIHHQQSSRPSVTSYLGDNLSSRSGITVPASVATSTAIPVSSTAAEVTAAAASAAKKARRQRRRAHDKEKLQQAKATLEAARSKSCVPSAVDSNPLSAPALASSVASSSSEVINPASTEAADSTCHLVKRGRSIIDLANQLFIKAELAVHKQSIEMLSMRAIKSIHRQLGAVIKDHNLVRRREKRQGWLKQRKKNRQQQHNDKHNKRLPAKEKKKKGQKKSLKLSGQAAITKHKRKAQHLQHRDHHHKLGKSGKSAPSPTITAPTPPTSASTPSTTTLTPSSSASHRSSAQSTSNRYTTSGPRPSLQHQHSGSSNNYHSYSNSHHPYNQSAVYWSAPSNSFRSTSQSQHSGTHNSWRSDPSNYHHSYARSSLQRNFSAHSKPPESRGINKPCNLHRQGNCKYGKNCRFQH